MIDVVQVNNGAVDVVRVGTELNVTMALNGVIDVISGAQGPRGSTGEVGAQGPAGQDGEAQIPDTLDGGNF